MTISVPIELDAPQSHGFTMRGWDFTGDEVREAIARDRILNPAVEFGTNVCPWNCAFCFTEDPANLEGGKRRLTNEMSIERRLRLIDELAELGCRSINFVGAGEPTIEPHFWELLDRMGRRGITPIVYTEGALRLQRSDFANRLLDVGATVVVKVNSLTDSEYQNAVVRGNASKISLPTLDYTSARNRAIEVLLEAGFAHSVPTRLAFDTIITMRNASEIETIHRYARRNNIFVLFVNYLPSGRSSILQEDALPLPQQQELFARLSQIDRNEFGLVHGTSFPYGGGVPCTIRGLGLYIKVTGEVFDCPGESERLGSLAECTVKELWTSAKHIRNAFNGMCFPRQQFWQRVAEASHRSTLHAPT